MAGSGAMDEQLQKHLIERNEHFHSRVSYLSEVNFGWTAMSFLGTSLLITELDFGYN